MTANPTWILGAIATIFSGVILYLTKAVVEMPGKFVLKTDCRQDANKLHQENREDHQLLFDEIKESVESFDIGAKEE